MLSVFFRKSFLNIFLLILIVIGLFATSSLAMVTRYVKVDNMAKSQALLEQTAQITRLTFQAFDTVNLLISSDHSITRALQRMTLPDRQYSDDDIKSINFLNNSMNTIIASGQYIHSVYIYMNGAHAYYSSEDRIVPITNKDGPWLSTVNLIELENGITNRTLVSGHSWGTDREIVSVFRTLFNGTGVAIVNVDVSKLRDDIQQYVFYPGQQIHLTDGNNHTWLAGDYSLSQEDLTKALTAETEDRIRLADGSQFLLSKHSFGHYGWSFLSFTPVSSFYALQHRMLWIAGVVTLACLILGIVISIFIAQKNHLSISSIIDAIETVEQGGELPEIPIPQQDVYTYIIHNIISTGILKKYMEIQITEKKNSLRLLELSALQYQINPHFLVNTLKTIYWNCVERTGFHSPDAKMLENLLDITGYSLKDPEAFVTVGEELLHTKSYADILIQRHQGELDVIWDYDDTTQNAICEKLILQPFLENAFYHGIRKTNTPGTIKVRVRIVNNIVVIKVIDNGSGISREELSVIRRNLSSEEPPKDHIGIYNPHRRLVLTFGTDYGIMIRSKLGVGTSVEISFPYITDPSQLTDTFPTPETTVL